MSNNSIRQIFVVVIQVYLKTCLKNIPSNFNMSFLFQPKILKKFRKIGRRKKIYCRLIVKLDNKSAKDKRHSCHGNTNPVPVCSYIDSIRLLNFPGNYYIPLKCIQYKFG